MRFRLLHLAVTQRPTVVGISPRTRRSGRRGLPDRRGFPVPRFGQSDLASDRRGGLSAVSIACRYRPGPGRPFPEVRAKVGGIAVTPKLVFHRCRWALGYSVWIQMRAADFAVHTAATAAVRAILGASSKPSEQGGQVEYAVERDRGVVVASSGRLELSDPVGVSLNHGAALIETSRSTSLPDFGRTT